MTESNTRMDLPRLVIAAPMSGGGKTTITAGLIAAFAARGLRVAPFKVGPDYIDPTYHALAAGRECSNLDAWMLPPDRVGDVLARRSRDADLALIEGVMGLFDGYSGDDDTGSAAHIARITDAPVLLVLNARSMARTAAALVQGLRDFDSRIRLVGVILNEVGSSRHARIVSDAIASSGGVPVVGYLERDEELRLPERHLGLIPTLEPGRWQAWIDRVRTKITASIDLGRVLDLACAAPPLSYAPLSVARSTPATIPGARAAASNPPVIAVARDAAFHFIYAENLDLLREAGAEIAFFSPLTDRALPPGAGALYICGGFPEMYAADLAANRDLRAAMHAAAQDGLPIYAECGGLMYLTEEIVDLDGVAHPMAGVLPGRSVMQNRLTLGYRMAQAQQNSWLWRAGEIIRGHEFHYSTWNVQPDAPAPLYALLPDALRPEARLEGAQLNNVLASYVHLHFLACPALARRFVAAAMSQRRTARNSLEANDGSV